MADITQVPAINIAQWHRPDGEIPTLTQGVGAADTTLLFSTPLLDEDGSVITGGVVIAIVRASDGYAENVYMELEADGLSTTAAVRGIDLAGLDFTTGNADLAVAHKPGDRVYVVVTAFLFNALYQFIKGTIASGGTTMIFGNETDTTFTLQHKDATGLAPFLRRNIASGEVEFSDNRGVAWTAINDVTASNLLDVSAADTTPGYLDTKLTVGGIITKAIGTPGGNETLDLSTPAGVATSAGAGDSGKIALLGAAGVLDETFMPAEVVSTADYAAKGDMLTGTGAGTATLKTVGANGTVPVADSTDENGIVYAYRNEAVDITPTSTTVVNTTTETTVYTYTVPANQLGTTNAIRVKFSISDLDFDDQLSIKMEYDGSTLGLLVMDPVVLYSNQKGVCEFILMANDADNAQIAECNASVAQYGTSYRPFSTSALVGGIFKNAASGVSAVDSTVDKDLTVSVQFDTASANNSITVRGFITELLVAN